MHNHLKKVIIRVVVLTAMSISSGVAIAGCTPSLLGDSSFNICIGTGALLHNMASANVAIGNGSLGANSTGIKNTSVGTYALSANSTGSLNNAFGSGALMLNTDGGWNVAVGTGALSYNIHGNSNAAVGYETLVNNSTGNYNTSVGFRAAHTNTSGSYNLALGHRAGFNITTGSNNIDISNQGLASDSSTIRIGEQGTQRKAYIAAIYGSTVVGSAVVVSSSGQLGVASSSRRYKEDIQPMGDVSDRLMNLQPVTFRYKEADQAGNKSIQYGLIAEDVDTVMPELVVRNEDGSPETVAYHVLPSLLLNEYQKQHQELVETKAKLAGIEADMERLKQTMERLIAALPTTTKVASVQ